MVLYRVGTQTPNQDDFNNHIAICFNIDTRLWFAHLEWQFYVDTVAAACKDRHPSLSQHLERVWMSCDFILRIVTTLHDDYDISLCGSCCRCQLGLI